MTNLEIREVECFYCNGSGRWLEQTADGLIRSPCGECEGTGKLHLPVLLMEVAEEIVREKLK